MDYPGISALGLPCGSEAIESAVRRVINLRIKGPGILFEGTKRRGYFVIAILLQSRTLEPVETNGNFLRIHYCNMTHFWGMRPYGLMAFV